MRDKSSAQPGKKTLKKIKITPPPLHDHNQRCSAAKVSLQADRHIALGPLAYTLPPKAHDAIDARVYWGGLS